MVDRELDADRVVLACALACREPEEALVGEARVQARPERWLQPLYPGRDSLDHVRWRVAVAAKDLRVTGLVRHEHRVLGAVEQCRPRIYDNLAG